MINLLGMLLIALIAWWFWIYKPQAVMAAKNLVTVIADNGTYEPSRIPLLADQDTTLRFIRKDASPCAEAVVFGDFDISEELPLNKRKDVHLPAMETGEYTFACQMQMYRGTLIVNKIVLGFFLLASAWNVLHGAQQAGVLATSGWYASMRHPQYVAFVLIMFGFLLQWPTIPTLVMFPVLLVVYLRLSKVEEQQAIEQFGDQYIQYRQSTPAFIPKFGTQQETNIYEQ
jgi:protein-S-isoprenylcysteine O-methyltransferase Ste14